MAYDSERILKAVKALLQTNLPDELDAVEALWQATDPVTLPEPVTWFEGHKPTVLELPSTSFPFVAVLVPNRTSEEGQAGRWGYEEVLHEAAIHYFVVAATEEIVGKIAHRYAEAIVRVLQAQKVIAQYGQRHYEPAVSLSVASRHTIGGTTGDAFDESEVDYIRMGEVATTLEGA
jgi:hypothetical protein